MTSAYVYPWLNLGSDLFCSRSQWFGVAAPKYRATGDAPFAKYRATGDAPFPKYRATGDDPLYWGICHPRYFVSSRT